MADFLWSIFDGTKNHSRNWTSECHLEEKSEPPNATFENSSIRFEPPNATFLHFSSKWHSEVQFQEWFLGPSKIDHKKLAIRKKSTILGFLPSNFNTQLVTPLQLQEKFLVKIGGQSPPKIKVQR